MCVGGLGQGMRQEAYTLPKFAFSITGSTGLGGGGGSA